MDPLRHIVEPSRLLMTWQPADEPGKLRTRRTVGEIVPATFEKNEWTFKYFLDTPDLIVAQKAGFKGHPAFKLEDKEFSQGVRETMLRRLPPRSREDFPDFLAMHRLPNPFPLSDMALLGYTGAKLPSDGFALLPQFPSTLAPCEYILEIAGIRHVYKGSIDTICIGDVVNFQQEIDNEVDRNAIVVLHLGQRLGYVNRAFLSTFHAWMECGSICASIERKNGTVERPIIYIRFRVNC